MEKEEKLERKVTVIIIGVAIVLLVTGKMFSKEACTMHASLCLFNKNYI